MADAWMKRSSERQALLDTLKRAIVDEEEESHRRVTFQLALCTAFLEFFKGIDRLYPPPFVPPGNSQERFLAEKILPAIRDFSRTDEETLALATDLFDWECQSISRYFKAPLQQQELDEPEKLYDGHKAMDKVEL